MTETVAPSESHTATGTICMWNGTSDGKEGYVDVGNNVTNINLYQTVPIRVQDMRYADPKRTLKRHGYEHLRYPTAVPTETFLASTTPENKAILEDIYFKECNQLVKQVTGAAEAFTYVYRVRDQSNARSDSADVRKQNTHTDTVPTAHVDRDLTTAPDRLRHTLGKEKAEELMSRYSSWASVNVWRPVGTARTVQKWPLCLVDHEDVPDWHYDTHMGRLHIVNDQKLGERGAKSHEAILKFDPGYKYYYASEMAQDEVHVFCAFHTDPRFGIPHCAFWDDSTAEDAPERISIEVRTWVFLE